MASISSSDNIHKFLFHPSEIKNLVEKKWAKITFVALTALSLGLWLAIFTFVNHLDSKKVKKGPVDKGVKTPTTPIKPDNSEPIIPPTPIPLKPSEPETEENNFPDLTIEQCRANAMAKGIKTPAKYKINKDKFKEGLVFSTDIPTPDFGQKNLKNLLNDVPEVKKWEGFKGNVVKNVNNLGMQQIFTLGLVTLGYHHSALNQTFLHQYKVVLDKISKLPKDEKERKFKYLAESFKACQPEQARTVNAMYAQFMGLGGTFQSQIEAWIQDKKKEIFEHCTYELHPHCNDENATKQNQLPHLTSGYLQLLGNELGMSDVEKASADHNRNRYLDFYRHRFIDLFWGKLNVKDFSLELVSQINQSLGDRFTSNQLEKWCKDNDCFKLCYIDDDNTDLYYQKPTEDQEYCSLPFISEFGALQILEKMGYFSVE